MPTPDSYQAREPLACPTGPTPERSKYLLPRSLNGPSSATKLMVPAPSCAIPPASGPAGSVPPGYSVHLHTGRVLPEAGNGDVVCRELP